MSEITISPLSDTDAFLSLWNGLLIRCSDTTFFQSPAWMTAWLAAPPDRTDLYTVKGKSGGELVLLGVISHRRRRQPPFFGLSETRLHEFGSKDHDSVYIEYNDFLIADGADEGLREMAVKAVISEIGGSDVFVFRNASPELAETIAVIAPDGDILQEQPVYVCDLASARAASADYIQTLGKSLRAKTRRALRKYEERGPVTFHIARTEGECARAWDALVEMHQIAWRARGKPGAFDNPSLLAFHERLRQEAADACHLFHVDCNGEPIGVLYNFVYGKHVMNYQSGFKYEDDNQLTPGFVCHILAAEYYLKTGHDTYDLLAGDADYKRRLGEQTTTLTSVAVDQPTWRNRLKRVLKK